MQRKGLLLWIGLALSGLSVARPGVAQTSGRPLPAGFVVRTDDRLASLSDLMFETMRPGWHITTGPAAILYDASLRAEGSYRVESETFLFEPGEVLEPYGIFVNGRDLASDAPSYAHFVIRHTGEFQIARRRGMETEALVDWTSHPSIVTWAARGEGVTAKNVLAMDADEKQVRFLVNDVEVSVLPRERVGTGGVVGLRVNGGISLHVSSLVVTKR